MVPSTLAEEQQMPKITTSLCRNETAARYDQKTTDRTQNVRLATLAEMNRGAPQTQNMCSIAVSHKNLSLAILIVLRWFPGLIGIQSFQERACSSITMCESILLHEDTSIMQESLNFSTSVTWKSSRKGGEGKWLEVQRPDCFVYHPLSRSHPSVRPHA